jgi:hypothetical protein
VVPDDGGSRIRPAAAAAAMAAAAAARDAARASCATRTTPTSPAAADAAAAAAAAATFDFSIDDDDDGEDDVGSGGGGNGSKPGKRSAKSLCFGNKARNRRNAVGVSAAASSMSKRVPPRRQWRRIKRRSRRRTGVVGDGMISKSTSLHVSLKEVKELLSPRTNASPSPSPSLLTLAPSPPPPPWRPNRLRSAAATSGVSGGGVDRVNGEPKSTTRRLERKKGIKSE